MQKCRLPGLAPPNNWLIISSWGLMICIFSQFPQIRGSPTLQTLEPLEGLEEHQLLGPSSVWFRGWSLRIYISSESFQMLLRLLIQGLETRRGAENPNSLISLHVIQNSQHPWILLRKEDIFAWALKSYHLMADFINRLTTYKWQKHWTMLEACYISLIIPMEIPCDLVMGCIQGCLLDSRSV